ncbi:MAG: acyltransferase [Bacteroidia bacterium]|nr:acyltransferase [Bacteroidia bacterium]
MKTRLFYIDYIRLFLCCVVIFHHTAIGFGASGGWYYYSPTRLEGLSQLLYSILMGIDQSYFMSLFFFVSALFTPQSLERKGVTGFLRDRFFRLVVPMLLYIFVLNPILIWYIYPSAGYECQLGPLWFVFSLLFFELSYILIRKAHLTIPPIRVNTRSMSIFALSTGLLAFTLRIFTRTNESFMGITLANFILYIAMYAMGIIAARQNLLDSLSLRRSSKWLLFAALWIFIMLASTNDNIENTSGGFNITSLAYSLWEAVSCVAISYSLLTVGKRFLNVSHPLFESLAADSFIAFVIHPFPVVWLTMVMEDTHICPELLIPITSILAIVLSLTIAHTIRCLCHRMNYKWV